MKRIKLLLSLLFLMASCFTVSAQELAAENQMNFDKAVYSGYKTEPVVILSDAGLNAYADKRDEIKVTVKSTSDPNGITVKLLEDAVNSGIFKGSITLDPSKSDAPKNKLRVAYADTITAIYTDSDNSVSYTCSSVWNTSTDIVEFNKDSFSGLYSSATVIVNDRNLNLSPTAQDKAKVLITSDLDSKGFTLMLSETGLNTGIFTGSFKFSTTVSDSGSGVIKVGPTNTITAAYANSANTIVTAKSAFKFTEAVIATSAENDYGEGNMLDIIIYEPDNNNPDVIDRITAKIGAGNSTDDLTVALEETGANTGEFKRTVYFTDRENKRTMLDMLGMKKVNIKYNDKTVPQGASKDIIKSVGWEYQSTMITLDKKSYEGYNGSAKITLYNMELNKRSDRTDSVFVDVTTNHLKELRLELKETKNDTGIFTGTIYFGRTTKRNDQIIKMDGEDSITVSYTNPRNKSDVSTCSADWSPHDGKLVLNKHVYSGNTAPVSITLEDWDAADNLNIKDKVTVVAKIPGTSTRRTITLEETRRDSGVFKGTLYINGGGDKDPTIELQLGNTLEVAYIDKETTKGSEETRTVTAVWNGISRPELSLNQTGYKGYGTYMQISLKDPDYNKNTNAPDSVGVLVKTSANPNGVRYTLKETGSGTGVFTASLQLSQYTSNISSVKVSDTDKITVIFVDKNVSVTADFSK